MKTDLFNLETEEKTRNESRPASSVDRRIRDFRRRRLLQVSMVGWLLVDAAIAAASVILAFAISPYTIIGQVTGAAHVQLLPCTIAYAVCLSMVSHIAGLHDPRYARRIGVLFARSVTSVGISLCILFLGFWLIYYLRIGRYILLTTGVVTTAGMIVTRLIAQIGTAKIGRAVCFLGDDEFCFRAARLAEQHSLSQRVLTTLDFENGENKEGLDLDTWAFDKSIDEIVYDASGYQVDDASLLKCLARGIRVTSYSDFVEDNLFFVPVEQIDAKWMFTARLDLARPYYYGVKRIAEIAACVCD